MRDDFLTADWAGSRTHLITAIRAFVKTLGDSFATLHRHQFDAPWRHDVTPETCSAR